MRQCTMIINEQVAKSATHCKTRISFSPSGLTPYDTLSANKHSLVINSIRPSRKVIFECKKLPKVCDKNKC